METRNEYRIFVGKSFGKWPFERSKRKLKNNIQTDLIK
jgi:hypothetical protein